jgi:hypothetical protein
MLVSFEALWPCRCCHTTVTCWFPKSSPCPLVDVGEAVGMLEPKIWGVAAASASAAYGKECSNLLSYT